MAVRITAAASSPPFWMRRRRRNRSSREASRLAVAVAASASVCLAAASVAFLAAPAAPLAPQQSRPRTALRGAVDADPCVQAPAFSRRQPVAVAAVAAAAAWLRASGPGPLTGAPPAARAAEGGPPLRVVRPTEGPPVYEFEIPAGRGFELTALDGSTNQPGLVSKYRAPNGALVIVGEAPEKDWITRTKKGALRARQKTLKYTVSESQDDLEVLVKVFQEDGSETIVHRWYRVLRQPESQGGLNVLMIAEIPDDLRKELAPSMEGIISTFRLVAA